MSQILGTLLDSGGNPLSGKLRVTLTGNVIEVSPNPDAIYIPEPSLITITNGVIDITLEETETKKVTYRFEFFKVDVDDNLIEPALLDFYALVPNVSPVQFASLVPTGMVNDLLDTGALRIARIIADDPNLASSIGGPFPRGEWLAGSTYKFRDLVTYLNRTYISKSITPLTGVLPTDTNNWMLIPVEPDGSLILGDATPYGVSWNGSGLAASQDTVYDVIESLNSNISSRAPVNSPNFTGNINTTGNLNVSGSISSQYWKRVNIPFTGIADYINFVIPLHPRYVSISLDSNYCVGKIFLKRGNPVAANIVVTLDINTASAFNSNKASLTVVNDSNISFDLVTFTYQGIAWVGIRASNITSLLEADGASFEGFHRTSAGSSHALNIIGYYNNNTATATNTEINNSLTPFAPNLPINLQFSSVLVNNKPLVNYGTFTVGGNSSNYYPVRFALSPIHFNTKQKLQIYRPAVHDNGLNSGSFHLEFAFHPTNYGNIPTAIEIINYQIGSGTAYGDPLGDILDGSTANGTGNDVIVWLKGGATYYWRCPEASSFWTLIDGNTSGTGIYDSSGSLHQPRNTQSTLILNSKGWSGTSHSYNGGTGLGVINLAHNLRMITGSVVVTADGSGQATITLPLTFNTVYTTVLTNGDASISGTPEFVSLSGTTLTIKKTVASGGFYRVNLMMVGTV